MSEQDNTRHGNIITRHKVISGGLVAALAVVGLHYLSRDSGEGHVNGTTTELKAFKAHLNDEDQRMTVYTHAANIAQCFAPENTAQRISGDVLSFIGLHTVSQKVISKLEASNCLSARFTGINGTGPGTVITEVKIVDTDEQKVQLGNKTTIHIPGSAVRFTTFIDDSLSEVKPKMGTVFAINEVGNQAPGPGNTQSAQDQTIAQTERVARLMAINDTENECIRMALPIIKRGVTASFDDQLEQQYKNAATKAATMGQTIAPFNAKRDVAIYIDGSITIPAVVAPYPPGETYHMTSNVAGGCQVALPHEFKGDHLDNASELTLAGN